MSCRLFIGLVLVLLFRSASAQHRYFRELNAQVVAEFKDSAQRIVTAPEDSIRLHQFNYVLNFFPNLLCKNIIIDFKFSKHVVRTKPKLLSVFKAPSQRTYKVSFSKSTASTMDSVLIQNLSFNSQIGLIGNQMAIIEDLSTGGFFNFLKFYGERLTAKGKNRMYRAAEERCLELGLGHQLLSYNLEFIDKLRIEKWQSTQGYDTYIHFYRNRPMKPETIRNLVIDLPVYVQNKFD